MLYDLVGRFAGIGGECALVVLFLVSTVSVAIVCDRVWFFAHRMLDIDLFAGRLVPLLRARDWLGSRQLAQQSLASPSVVVMAGLSRIESPQIENDANTVRAVMRAAAARERLRLDAYLGLLRALGCAAVMVGGLGTVFDIWEFLNSPAMSNNGKTVVSYNAISVLAPLAAGLLAATPALFVASVLTSYVQKIMGEVEFITEFVMSQIAVEPPTVAEKSKPFALRAA